MPFGGDISGTLSMKPTSLGPSDAFSAGFDVLPLYSEFLTETCAKYARSLHGPVATPPVKVISS